MKAQILKIAGVKSEKEFYKKFPTEEAFMKKHGKELKKAQYGTYVAGQPEKAEQKPIMYDDLYQDTMARITGISKEERARQEGLAALKASKSGQEGQGTGIAGAIGQAAGMMSKAGLFGGGGADAAGGEVDIASSIAGALGKNGKKLKKAQVGDIVPADAFDPQMPSDYQASNLDNIGKDAFGGIKSFDFAKGDPRINSSAAVKTGFDYAGAFKKMPGALGSQLGTLIGSFQQIEQNKKDIKKANQWADISQIGAQAALSRPEQSKRRYARPEDNLVTGMNPLGKKDSLLAAQNGAEIQNTYNPGDLYSDLGYEPLNDSNPKQYVHGGYLHKAQTGMTLNSFAGAGGDLGGMLGSKIGGGSGQGGPGSKIGSTVGGILGMAIPIPGVGSFIGSTLGGLAGGLFDAGDQNKLQEAQDRQTAAINQATIGAGASNLQKANKAFMEDGGYMNPEYNPQVIAKFGDYTMDQLLAPPHDADMLRSGGHLAQVHYTPPSAAALYTGRDLPYQMQNGGQMAMGGDLQVHRGEAETMSYNPFLPDGGETVMFRGPSHDNGGMPISYGNNGVEVEGGEPAIKLQDGGSPDGNLVVYGNMVIPKYGVAELNDPKAKGKKFKHYVADLSKLEAKQNKLVEKTTQLINNADANDQFDKLTLNTGQANLIGTTMKLKDIAEKKKTAAAVQNAILDTASEMGLESDALAKGKIKYAKANDPYAEFGTKLSKAQTGKSVDPNDDWIRKILNYEITKGSATGKGLSNFGYNDWDKFGHEHAPRSMDEAVEYFKQDYLPKVNNIPLGLRGRAGDWAFNTGKDPRIPLLMAAGKIKSNAFGLAGPRVELAQDPEALDELWNKHSAEIAKKENDPEFLKKFDTARKVMYQNIKRLPDGSINPAYKGTWKGRTEEIFKDDYNKQAVTVPAAATKTPATGAKSTSSATPAKASTPAATSVKPAAAPVRNNYSVGIGSTLDGAVSLSPIAEAQPSAYIPNLMDQINMARFENSKDSKLLDDVKVVAPKSTRFLPNELVGEGDYVPEEQQIVGQFPITDYVPITPKSSSRVFQFDEPETKESKSKKERGPFPWETVLAGVNSVLPFLRPSNQIPLDPSQLSGELYALSQNQEEPVFAQSYQPLLSQATSISLQDQLNEITSQARAAERMAQGNPAALAMIASQAAEAKNKVLGEQFRMNQGEAQRVAETNRQTMNEAMKTNLGLYDQQQQRAAQAKSNTKMQNIAALNSINDKIAKQKLENRQLGIMENLYNYRFTPNGVAYNMNPLANWNMAGGTGAGKGTGGVAPEGYEFETILKKKKASKDDDTDVARNGSIVKAIKNL